MFYGQTIPRVSPQVHRGENVVFFDDASRDRSAEYTFLQGLGGTSGAGTFSYDATNKRYEIAVSTASSLGVVVKGLTGQNFEISADIATSGDSPNNQLGFLMRYTNSTPDSGYWGRMIAAGTTNGNRITRTDSGVATDLIVANTSDWGADAVNNFIHQKAYILGQFILYWQEHDPNINISVADPKYNIGYWGIYLYMADSHSAYFKNLKIKKVSLGTNRIGLKNYLTYIPSTTSIKDLIGGGIIAFPR